MIVIWLDQVERGEGAEEGEKSRLQKEQSVREGDRRKREREREVGGEREGEREKSSIIYDKKGFT